MPFLTTKKQKRKQQSPSFWIGIMIVIIFIIIFKVNNVMAQAYDMFDFMEDPQWIYLDYLPYNTPINVAVVDTGYMPSNQYNYFHYNILGFYKHPENDRYDSSHGPGVASIIVHPHDYKENFKGLCPQCNLLYANIHTFRMEQAADASVWAISKGAQLINYSFIGFPEPNFGNVLKTHLESNPNFFAITAGGNDVSNAWDNPDFGTEIWSIGGLQKNQETIIEGFQTTLDNTNIKFSAPAENTTDFESISSGTSNSSPLFLGAIARILSYTNNGYTRAELYDLLVSYGTPIPNGGYKVRWGDLIQSEFGITRTRKHITVKDVSGADVKLIIDLIYEQGTYIKSYVTRYELNNVVYQVNKELL